MAICGWDATETFAAYPKASMCLRFRGFIRPFLRGAPGHMGNGRSRGGGDMKANEVSIALRIRMSNGFVRMMRL